MLTQFIEIKGLFSQGSVLFLAFYSGESLPAEELTGGRPRVGWNTAGRGMVQGVAVVERLVAGGLLGPARTAGTSANSRAKIETKDRKTGHRTSLGRPSPRCAILAGAARDSGA